jgi:hypothetical protein
MNDSIQSVLQGLSPSVTFVFGDKLNTITLPFASFDLKASAPFYSKQMRYFPLQQSDDDSIAILGRAFLQEALVSCWSHISAPLNLLQIYQR